MNIRFITPPKELQKGGIENAIEGLREALQARGTDVMDGPALEDPNAIHHFHGLWNPSHTRFAAKLRKAGRPYVVSPHGMLEPWAFRNRAWKKLPYFHFLEKRMLAGAAALLVTSEMEKRNLSLLMEHQRVEVLPLGCRDPASPDFVEARNQLGWQDTERVMVFLSRVDPKKGLHLLFEALASTDLPTRSWRLVIVGDGPSAYRETLDRLQNQLADKLPPVEWVGPVWGNERWKFLQGADLFCLPTHSENFGIAVLEALHVGTPVLTTTGTPWAECGKMDGIFIAKPDVDSLRMTLEEADRRITGGWNKSDRTGLAKWAEQDFSWNNLVERYRAAYATALQQRSTNH